MWQKVAKFKGAEYFHKALYMQMIQSYSAAPSPDFLVNALQQSFLSIQNAFSALNLVLNTSKTKVMWFGKKITTFEGLEL